MSRRERAAEGHCGAVEKVEVAEAAGVAYRGQDARGLAVLAMLERHDWQMNAPRLDCEFIGL